MDFARKQLEKYGWSDGKGLGKHENGISEPLKPKLKRSVTGVGHDPASEFNEHWWSALYDKAAKNVEVEEKNGKTKKITTKDSDNFVITSSTWKINKKQSKQTDEAQYSEYFVRTAVLTNDKGGRKTENVKESESEDEVGDKKDVLKMTDEELFAACGGRTAHKGARHGLRAIGKLARIAEQEKKLLIQPQYEGYSHAKMLKQKVEESIDQMTINEDILEVQKKKKKRKRCINENDIQLVESGSSLPLLPDKKLRSKRNRDTSKNINVENGRNSEESITVDCEVDNVKTSKKKKKRKNEDKHADIIEITDLDDEVSESKIKKKRKKKVESEQLYC